jgi:hypothetical protein
MVLNFIDRHASFMRAGAGVVWLLLALGRPPSAEARPQEAPPDEPAPDSIEAVLEALIPAPEEATAHEAPNLTAAGAVRFFMASRDYRKLREIRSVMTSSLRKRFDYNSAPFNGKRGVRLAAFDFGEADFSPVSRGRTDRYDVTVRSLWEDQGEAVEERSEIVRVGLQENGLWRVENLKRVESEHSRFTETVPGVTALRLVLRAWDRGRVEVAERHLSANFLRRYAGHEEALRDLIVGPRDPRHTAFRILEMTPRDENAVIARVQLILASPGQPGPLEGETHTLAEREPPSRPAEQRQVDGARLAIHRPAADQKRHQRLDEPGHDPSPGGGLLRRDRRRSQGRKAHEDTAPARDRGERTRRLHRFPDEAQVLHGARMQRRRLLAAVADLLRMGHPVTLRQA